MSGPPKHYSSLLRARRGYLGVTGPDGVPEVLPVCFTWAGDAIWIAIGNEGQLLEQRITFLVDRWDEDWTKLSWLVAKGMATILPDGEESDRAMDALESKYSEYLKYPHYGPILRMDVEEWEGIDALQPESEDWGG
jgi:nitroimidazol reductase NimA-like FMN-containing flavoprotein (pyridoxamine 5'-phosphate oxidase superfamily)